MDVLITGASGTVGTAITDALDDDRYDFTLLDVEAGEAAHADSDTDAGDRGERVVADVTDYEGLRPHFEGRDAVVHLALVPGTGGAGNRDLAWSDPLADNLEGINNVFAAARDAGLDSIVFASSNHAVGMAEMRNAPEVYYPDSGVELDDTEPHRPDSPYGLTKSYGEDLGRLAAEAHGIRFYGLRIGAVRTPEYDHPYGDAERGVEAGDFERGSDAYAEQVARMKCLWQSRRDLGQMVDRCLQDESVEWDHFYGRSETSYSWLSIKHAKDVLGYQPRDDAGEWDGPPE
jgi:nucleoside-diphosphate-sugar epimerase